MELQEKYLPNFDFCKTESSIINCSKHKIFPLIKNLEFNNSKIIYWLFKLRGIPVPESLTLQGLEKLGFIKLDLSENEELILGLVGKFWTLNGNLLKMNSEEFLKFNNPEFAKTTWNFKLIPIHLNQTKITTETRIFCPNSLNKKKFKLYWIFIQPFSSIIRKEILKNIKNNAEKNNCS